MFLGGSSCDEGEALFFDIDGTLVSFNTHRIPDSTVEALRQAKANGVKVLMVLLRQLC